MTVRKHLYLVVESSRDSDMVGCVETRNTPREKSSKNEQTVHHGRDVETLCEWERTLVSMGYHDFDSEDQFERQYDNIIKQKLAEIDERHLRDAGLDPDDVLDDVDESNSGPTAEVMTDGGNDPPLPATGTIVPKKTGHRVSIDCATEYISEADRDYLYQAAGAAALKYGRGKEVRVRFTGSGYTCNGFELLGPVDETPDDVQRLNDVRRMLDTSRWPSLTPEQTDRIEDAFDTVDSVTREVQTADEDGGADIDRGEGTETDGGDDGPGPAPVATDGGEGA